MDSAASAAAEFVWATGLEDTFVVHESPGRRRLDELELVGHYESYRSDIDRALAVGSRMRQVIAEWS